MSAGALTPPSDSRLEDEASELIARCKGGDGAAWRKLYVAHFGYVSRLARNLGTPPAEIEDVIQEVFTVAFRKLGDFTQGQFTTWLYRICANVVTDHHRKRRVRSAFAALFGSKDEEPSPQPGADRQLEQAQARVQVGRILEKMSPKKREVFVLFEIEGLKGDEIAEKVGCPVDTVWTRLFHARKEFARLGAQAQLLDGGCPMKPLPSEPQRLLDGGGEDPSAESMRRLLSRLSEPPVEEVSRERIWRRMTQPQTATSDRAWYGRLAAMAAVMLMLTAGLALHNRRLTHRATLEMSSGPVLTAQRGEAWSRPSAGLSLGEDARVRTEAEGRALVTMGAQAALLAGPNSDLALESLGARRFIRWSGSSISVVVGGARPPLTVQATAYGIEASTAAFEVLEQTAGEMTVSVDRGEVEIFEGARRWRVAAGERWTSNRPDGPRDPSLRSPAIPILDQALRPGGHPALTALSPSAPAPIPFAPPTRAAEALPPPPVASPTLGRPLPPVANPPAHARPTADRGPTPSPPAPSVASSRTVPLPVATLPPPSPKPPVAPEEPAFVVAPPPLPPTLPVAQLEPSPTPSTLPAPALAPAPRASAPAPLLVASAASPAAPQHYEEGLDLERAGRFSEAARRFQSVVSGQDPHADLALYELGRLEQRKLDDLPGARDAFSRYLDDYPHGSLQQEVRLSLMEVDAALSKSKEALSQASTFLDTYPSSERAPDVRLLRANLLREKGRCDDALDDYRQLVAHPTLGEESLFFSAWCQRQGDHADNAEASLRELLQRFPNGRYASEARAALAGGK